LIDVLVVGGGPTGLAAAIGAALAGFETVLLEPRRGVIDKACGEGLMPGALGELARLGVAPQPAQPFAGIRYVDGERSVAATFRTPGAGLRRTVLHEALGKRAEAVGVVHREQRADGVRQDASGVETAGIRARWLVAADGLHSPIRRQLGLLLPPRRAPRLGARRHFACARVPDCVEVHLAPGMEAYVTPVSADEVGVAILYAGARRIPFARLLGRFPALAGRLGEPRSSERGAGPFEQRVRRRVAGRVLLAGDAAGYLDPLTGEGLHLGFASARLAVESILRGAAGAYERRWRRRAMAPWCLTAVLLRVRRTPPLASHMVPVLAHAPWLFGAGLRVLAGAELPAKR
jgi:flavin-dependent dehydrogenase